MKESWRWFGPNDPVSIEDIRQTGATDIVSALHNIPTGEVWSIAAIKEHQALIETTPAGLNPLTWSVVESIPVHEDIKLQRPGHERYVANWITSMQNLAACGIKTICYNFMPVIDWTRTDLRYKMPSGAYALRFDQLQFSVFDLCILKREHAEKEYTQAEIDQANQAFEAMTEQQITQLTNNIIAGLPGKMTDDYSVDDFREMVAQYQDVSHEVFRSHLFEFLFAVLPYAEKDGVKLAIHPDDPPRDLLGLPRVVCTSEDYQKLFAALPSPANGLTLCVGTLGSRPDNNLPQMAREFSDRIFFSHLRGVSLDPQDPRTFYEANHLDSDVNMIQVIKELLNEEKNRASKGADHSQVFIRPDHGHQMMDDIHKSVNPGYTAIGRLKGLAELRGVIRTLESL